MCDFSKQLENHSDVVMELDSAASAAYDSFVYEDDKQADAVRRLLWAQGALESSPPHGTLLVRQGAPIGLLTCLTASDVQRRRLATALALRRSGLRGLDSEFARRVRLAAGALLQLQPGDFYLSRVAVLPEAQGQGWGRYLLEEYLRRGLAERCQRFVLEVSPTAEAALGLYRGHGFEELARRRIEDRMTNRVLEYVHLSRLGIT